MRPVSITHRDHFVNIARRRALEANKLAAAQRETNEKQTNGLSHVGSKMMDDKLTAMQRESNNNNNNNNNSKAFKSQTSWGRLELKHNRRERERVKQDAK